MQARGQELNPAPPDPVDCAPGSRIAEKNGLEEPRSAGAWQVRSRLFKTLAGGGAGAPGDDKGQG